MAYARNARALHPGTRHGLRRTLLLGMAAPALLHGTAALAQVQTSPPPPSNTAPASTQSPDASTIVVTGSRIRRKAVSAQPIESLSGTDLSALGATNVG